MREPAVSETEDLYEILHLHPSAHPDVIQAAYRRLALLYHPDKNPAPEASEMMAAVNRAYEVLSDPEKRAEYDHSRVAQSGTQTSGEGTGPSAASASQASRPSNAPRNPTGYFTLGSSKSDVADIHGPPGDVSIDQYFRAEVWHYGSDDTIEFDVSSGKVQGWSNIRRNLRIKLIPGPNVTSLDYFMIGAHRDEVARLHGTPVMIMASQELDREIWVYDGPEVTAAIGFSFSTGRLNHWESDDSNLKARRQSPSQSTRSGIASTSSAITTSNWRTFSDKYNDVGIYAVDSFDSDHWLIVRFVDRELSIFVIWGNAITYSESTTVNYQIGNGPTWRQSWSVGTSGGRATFMPSQDTAETIRALFDANELTVRVYPFGGNPITASFDVRGFREAAGPVLDAWRRAGSPAPGHTAQPGCLPFLLPVGALGVAAAVIPASLFLL